MRKFFVIRSYRFCEDMSIEVQAEDREEALRKAAVTLDRLESERVPYSLRDMLDQEEIEEGE